jgi:hypothetical protein
MAQRNASFFAHVSVAAVALAACTPSPVQPPPPDAAYIRPDAFILDSCDPSRLHVLMGAANGVTSIDLDTTMSTGRPRDLGLGCGNTAADARWANQEVIEFHVPGAPSTMQGVAVSTNNTMTQMNFNTVLEVRTGDCRTAPATAIPPVCFDDVSATNLLSDGGFTVPGGSVVYVFVTGYSHPPAMEMAVDQGTVHVDFRVAPNTAPSITSGTALFSMGDTLITAVGTDAEGPIAGYSMAFYNAAGPIDLTGDGVIDAADQLLIPFDTVDRAAPMYTGHSHISGTTQYALATYCHTAGVNCTQFGLRLYDQQFAFSNELRVAVLDAAIVGNGAACDPSHLCAPGLACTVGNCSVTAAATSLCNAAMPITIATPTTAATSTVVSGHVAMATGTFNGSCGMSTGAANIWTLTVPAGTYDLALTTATSGTGAMVDSVLYVRSSCVDQTTELPMGCNDDISQTDTRSALHFQNIAAGTYSIFVTSYGANSAFAYGLSVTLTPVLPSGSTCDPTMTNYRCAIGTCGSASHTCP